MSLLRYIDVCCDLCGKIYDNGAWTGSEARNNAKGDGWTRYRGEDLCPDCQEES
jgi:hypothetical protein